MCAGRNGSARPPPVPYRKPEGPGWGWAALLLSFLEQDNLYNQINLTVPVEGVTHLDVTREQCERARLSVRRRRR